MTTLEREFYRSARGPAPSDEDSWRLVFDRDAASLIVRHEWRATGHTGVEDFPVAEFLAQHDAAAEALLALLFDRVPAAA